MKTIAFTNETYEQDNFSEQEKAVLSALFKAYPGQPKFEANEKYDIVIAGEKCTFTSSMHLVDDGTGKYRTLSNHDDRDFLGSGSGGSVWRSDYEIKESPTGIQKKRKPMACKVFRVSSKVNSSEAKKGTPGRTKEEKFQFIQNEARLASKIYSDTKKPTFFHQNEGDYYEAFIFMPLLTGKKLTPPPPPDSEEAKKPTPETIEDIKTKNDFDKLPFIEKIVTLITAIKDLKRLHDQNIAGRDIKNDNFLYDKEKKTLRLIDFGLGIKFTEKTSGSKKIIKRIKDSKGGGSAPWLSPEAFEKDGNDRASDIFSFGVGTGMWLTNEPIDKIRNVTVFPDGHPLAGTLIPASIYRPPSFRTVLKTERIPRDIKEKVRAFLAKMTDITPKKRPNADDLLIFFSGLTPGLSVAEQMYQIVVPINKKLSNADERIRRIQKTLAILPPEEIGSFCNDFNVARQPTVTPLDSEIKTIPKLQAEISQRVRQLIEIRDRKTELQNNCQQVIEVARALLKEPLEPLIGKEHANGNLQIINKKLLHKLKALSRDIHYSNFGEDEQRKFERRLTRYQNKLQKNISAIKCDNTSKPGVTLKLTLLIQHDNVNNPASLRSNIAKDILEEIKNQTWRENSIWGMLLSCFCRRQPRLRMDALHSLADALWKQTNLANLVTKVEESLPNIQNHVLHTKISYKVDTVKGTADYLAAKEAAPAEAPAKEAPAVTSVVAYD